MDKLFWSVRYALLCCLVLQLQLQVNTACALFLFSSRRLFTLWRKALSGRTCIWFSHRTSFTFFHWELQRKVRRPCGKWSVEAVRFLCVLSSFACAKAAGKFLSMQLWRFLYWFSLVSRWRDLISVGDSNANQEARKLRLSLNLLSGKKLVRRGDYHRNDETLTIFSAQFTSAFLF